MPIPTPVAEQLDALGCTWSADAPLARLVWWRVGGPADALVTVTTEAQLAGVHRVSHTHGLPLMPLGNGSNLLVSDDGVDGIVVRLGGELTASRAEGDVLEVGGGLKLAVLLNRAARHGWPGLDPFAGIPGTVGGSVRMNAGSILGETADLLIDARVVSAEGEVSTWTLDDLAPTYRHTALPDGASVASARLRLSGDIAASTARIQAFLARRKATQPLDMPSCGSTFTNPPGDAAGRLIEAAGLKGLRIGGAEVSHKHANFVVNTGEATAADVRAVIEAVQRGVEDHAGVRLTPEVKVVGRW